MHGPTNIKCVLQVIPSQLYLLFPKPICTTNSHTNKHKIMLTYMSKMRQVSPVRTVLTHGVPMRSIFVLWQKSDVLFAFSVHINGTVKTWWGKDISVSAHSITTARHATPPPFQQVRSTHNELRRRLLQWDVSSSTYKYKLANKVTANSIRTQAARSSKTLTAVYQLHGATSDRTKKLIFTAARIPNLT